VPDKNPHYPNLFAPLRIGPLELRNRLLLSAMTTGFGFEDGAPDERAIAYFAERTSGVGLAVVAFGAVAPEGRVEEKIPWMWRPDAGEVMRPLAAAIRARGALPCLQLGHGGRQVSARVIGEPPVGPSPLPPAVHTGVPPRALTVDDIAAIVRAFGSAARKAADAGFAAVEIHGAHGYLIQQFLSPQSNRRADQYGGVTVTERARFGMEVIAEVRRSAPELAVIVRINGSDVVPGGLTPSDAAEAAVAFVGAGAQALLVSAGVYGSVPYTIPLLDDAEATFLDSAAFIKGAVDVPVVAVGRFTLPSTAEAAIGNHQCDAVALGRGLLADPDWVAKAAAGHAADIRPCIATVQGCAGMLQHGGEISCAVNPSVGRESLPVIERAVSPSSVVVVGGGPAGLEAARRAAELGHHVVLHEQSDRLGGAMALAAQTPVLAHLRRLITWYERQLRASGVDIRLGSRATAAEGAGADLVVVAVGGSTAVPMIEGYEHLPAWTLEDLMTGEPSTLGALPAPGRPVVVGGGSRALSLALWMSVGGAEPTILSNGRLGTDTSGLTRRALVTRLHNRGIPMLTGRPTALLPEGVRWIDARGAANRLEADALVVCEPVQPNRFEVRTLPCTAQVGDARRVGDIPAAITDGRDAIDAFTREAALSRPAG
jgi:2,4-dienoyl-CoA reductase-like NADH-dependent reductase (Old Yellow Enzyme family)/thioredoxin reductase